MKRFSLHIHIGSAWVISVAGPVFPVQGEETPAVTNAVESMEVNAEPEKDRKSWLLAPTFVSNPAFGNGLGAVGMYFFNPYPSDTVSPASAITGVGIYSDTDSYFAGLFARLYFKEDTWRLAGGGVNGKINNEFNITGYDEAVEFASIVNGIFARLDRRVYGNWFLGGKAALFDIRYEEGNAASEDYFEQFEVEDQRSGRLGVVGSHDSRNHVRYPETGNFSEVSLVTVPEWLGAEDPYHAAELFGNQYLTITDGHVLAMRAYGRFTPSGTPYSGLSTLGRKSDLRGYTAGEIVAENLISLQAEYRWMFTSRLGAVGFLGVAQLYDGSMKNMSSDTFYPSGGIGVRFTLNKENKMNFRIDYAWGEDDQQGLYVGVGEAF